MYEKNMYDKKKLIILRIILVAVGGIIAGTALWQFFVYYPNAMRREFKISVAVVSAVVLAAIFGLSSKPVYRVGARLSGEIVKIGDGLGAKGTVAVVAGLLTAGMVGYLFDVIIREALTVWATRILSDVLVAMIFAALCCWAFTKWIAAPDEFEAARKPMPCVGYLLSASCFFDERVFAAADLLCNVKVSDSVLKALWKFDCGAEALERLKILMDSGAVGEIRCGEDFDTVEDYARAEAALASARRLKIVELDGRGFPETGAAKLDMFAVQDGKLREKFSARVRSENSVADPVEQSDGGGDAYSDTDGAADVKSRENTEADDANGQIIIDK